MDWIPMDRHPNKMCGGHKRWRPPEKRCDFVRRHALSIWPLGLQLPIQDLNIVYVGHKDFVAYKIERRNLKEWLKTKIQKIEDSISDNNVPISEASGLCKYCRYQTRCFNDGNGLTDKPLSIPKTSLG
jgi:hypothetical protein